MKTVIEMAREVWSAGDVYIGPSEKTLELFAEIVRADERNSWPAEMEAMERQVNILTDALAEQPAQQEPTKAMIDAAERIDWSDSDVRGNIVNMWQAMCAVAPQAQQEPVTWSDYEPDGLHHNKPAPEIAIADAYRAGVDSGIAAEREACAKLVEPNEEHRRDAIFGYLGGTEGVELLDQIATAIRARGSNT